MKKLYPQQPFPDTDEEARHYIPDDLAAQGLYMLYRKQGDSILDAMCKVLEASLGIGKDGQPIRAHTD